MMATEQSSQLSITSSKLSESLSGSEVPHLIDVREPDEFHGEHIKGATNRPLSQIESWLGEVTDSSKQNGAASPPIIVYCQSGMRSEKARQKIQETGCDVQHLEGGINAWKSAGLETKRAAKGATIGIMRQVQITIGVMNLAGFAAAYYIHLGFLAIPIFTSAGLLFAGVTGTCGMAAMLQKMPWNKG
jgi:rhodanese-related sulfurtransferase